MLSEQQSALFQKKYVQVPEGYLFEDGLLLSKEEIRRMPREAEEARKAYQEKSASTDKRYDYSYTRYIGTLRSLQDAPFKTPLPEKKAAAEPDEEHIYTHKEIQEEKALPVLILILIVIGAVAVGLSIYYTDEALKLFLPAPLAMLSSIIMILFNSTAFNLIFIFKSRKNYIICGGYFILFLVTTAFSMSNTVQVNFGRYYAKEQHSLTEHQHENAARVQLNTIDEQIMAVNDALKAKEEEIIYNTAKGYGTQSLRKEKSALQEKKNVLITSKLTAQKENPDVASISASDTKKTVKDKTFYDLISELLKGKISASAVQFWQSVLPAIFYDIIAPLSLATGFQLSGMRKKREEEKGV